MRNKIMPLAGMELEVIILSKTVKSKKAHITCIVSFVTARRKKFKR
jgi:hypothetical protein